MTKDRSGKSMIEMVTVMAVLSVIMAVAGAAFAAMMKADGAARNAVVGRTNLSRLAVQFRNDVRAARAASLEGGAQTLRVTLPDDTVAVYRIMPEEIERVRQRGDEILGREEYRLPGSRAHFEIDRSDPPVIALVQTTVIAAESAADGTVPAGRVVRIEAVGGRRVHQITSQEK